MDVLAVHKAEISATDYKVVDYFIYHYAAAYAATARSREDPRNRVFIGAWSMHKRHRPDCDCRSRMRRSPISHKLSERCLRHLKRRRNRLLELGILIIRRRSEKGGLIKASRYRRARGRSHAMWVGAEVEAAIMRVQTSRRGSGSAQPIQAGLDRTLALLPAAADGGELVAALAEKRRLLAPPAAPMARRWPSSSLHGPSCSCESCFAKSIAERGPPAKP